MRGGMSKRRKVILIVSILAICAGLAGWKLLAPKARPVRSASLNMLLDITPFDTPTGMPPTPTETLIPTSELPTPESLTRDMETWSGMPTYAESQPGYFFRVDYDASLWSLTTDETGAAALFHRTIPYCKIVPAAGRGLPRGWVVDDQFRDIGMLRYEVVTASQNGVPQFVNYFGGDGMVLTGFQVSFQEQMEACLQAAETVFATLSSVAAPTPTATLTETSIPTITPTP